MDIKSEVKNLVVYAQCEEAAAQRGDVDAEKSHQQRCQQSLDAINRWADMANAAIAYAEYQYQYDKGHGVLAWQQMVDYIGKRNKLWEEFVVARDKAMNQQ